MGHIEVSVGSMTKQSHPETPMRASQSARRRPEQRPAADPKIVDLTMYRAQRAYVRAADALPAGRKSLGKRQWTAKKAAAGTWTPAIRDLRSLADAAVPLAEAGASVADIIALVGEVMLPVLRAVDARRPIGPLWTIHSAEVKAGGEQDVAITNYAQTGTLADCHAAMDATLAQAVLLLRVYQRLLLDSAALELHEGTGPLPEHVIALIREAMSEPTPPKGA